MRNAFPSPVASYYNDDNGPICRRWGNETPENEFSVLFEADTNNGMSAVSGTQLARKCDILGIIAYGKTNKKK